MKKPRLGIVFIKENEVWHKNYTFFFDFSDYYRARFLRRFLIPCKIVKEYKCISTQH